MSDTMPNAPASPPAGKPLPDLTAAVLVVAFLAVGTWASYWAELRNDQYQLINLGECVYHGGKLYQDCWENKPPGLAWINVLGLVLTPGGQLGVWVLPGVAALLCIVPLWYSVGRLLSPTAARRTAVLAAVLFTLRLYDAPSINPDFYSAILELAACTLWLPAVFASFAGRRFAFGLLAGLFWSAATCVKQTGCVGLFAVTLVALALLVAKNIYGRRWLITALCAWFGFALGGAAVIVMLTREGTHQAAWDAIFRFNRGFATWDAWVSSLQSWPRFHAGLEPLQLPVWLAFVGIVVTISTGRANRVAKASLAALVLWWIVAVDLALMGPSRSMRYWQATFPPMIFLAAVGLYHLEEAFRRLDRGYRTALMLVSLTAALLLARPLVEHYKLGVATSYLAYTQEPSDRQRLADLGNQIQALVPKGERIYVAAYNAGVYVHADRRPACRFTYPRSAEQLQEILSDLAARKAYALLIPERPAPEFERPWCDAACHDQWNRLLDNYDPVLFVGPYKMWILKRPERPNPP
ncbi:MAG: glycosyltransferase family 39 protein [Planctomycetota bacterium]